jgi:hypothetical protein
MYLAHAGIFHMRCFANTARPTIKAFTLDSLNNWMQNCGQAYCSMPYPASQGCPAIAYSIAEVPRFTSLQGSDVSLTIQ